MLPTWRCDSLIWQVKFRGLWSYLCFINHSFTSSRDFDQNFSFLSLPSTFPPQPQHIEGKSNIVLWCRQSCHIKSIQQQCIFADTVSLQVWIIQSTSYFFPVFTATLSLCDVLMLWVAQGDFSHLYIYYGWRWNSKQTRAKLQSIFREKFKFQKMGPNKMQMNANHYHYADIVSCARGKKNS